jgi:hypothetical protein
MPDKIKKQIEDYEKSYHPDDTLICITYQELITTLHCNEKIINEQTVLKVFNDIVNQKRLSALQDVDFHKSDIAKKAKHGR